VKILVVDDDPTCRTIVALRLKGLKGVDVVEAEDGDKAWALLKRSHFDGAVIDWQMPGKSGLEIVRAIRRAGISMPLLMVSAETDKQRVVEAIHAGISDYLIKPFDTAALLAKLTRFAEAARPQALCAGCASDS
jgi:two-component system, chemotaxis family, chemotaxis protein CheY